MGDFSKIRVSRDVWTGAIGLVLGGMLAFGFIVDGLIVKTNGSPLISLANLPSELVRVQGASLLPLGTWLYVLELIPFVFFALGFRAILRSSGAGSALPEAALVAGLAQQILQTIHNLAVLAVLALVPRYVPGTGEAQIIEDVSRGLLTFSYSAFLPGSGVGGILMVISLVAFGVAQRSLTGPAALGWPLAVAAGVLLGAGFLRNVNPVGEIIALVGWLCYIIWTLTTSIGLVTAHLRARPATALTPTESPTAVSVG